MSYDINLNIAKKKRTNTKEKKKGCKWVKKHILHSFDFCLFKFSIVILFLILILIFL